MGYIVSESTQQKVCNKQKRQKGQPISDCQVKRHACQSMWIVQWNMSLCLETKTLQDRTLLFLRGAGPGWAGYVEKNSRTTFRSKSRPGTRTAPREERRRWNDSILKIPPAFVQLNGIARAIPARQRGHDRSPGQQELPLKGQQEKNNYH